MMIPLCVPNISGREGKYLSECVETTFVSSVGPFVDRFEQMVSEATGAQTAVATSSGTTALHAALYDAGVGFNDHVIIPSLTFIATANAVSHCGAIPIIVDVDTTHWGLNPKLVEEVLSEKCSKNAAGDLIYNETGRPVRAILPVFALGLPADVHSLSSLARQYEMPLIIDAAAAIGATYQGQSLAQMGADYVMLSFNGNKLITAGGGGAIISSSTKIGQRLKHLTATARVGAGYDHDVIGFNYRMTNLQAAVGVAQMERLTEFLERKAEIARFYAESFEDLDVISNFPEPENCQGSHWFSGVYLPDVTEQRMQDFREALNKSGIEARSFWKPIHLQTPYRMAPTHLDGTSDKIWMRVQPLPCSTHLQPEEQSTVISAVLDFWGS